MSRDADIKVEEQISRPEKLGLDQREKGPSSFTPKAFFIGAVFSFFLSIGAPYGNMALRGSYMALDFSTPGALFLFFFLVGILNVVLKLTSKNLSLALAFLTAVAIPYVAKVIGTPDGTLDLTSPGMIFSHMILLMALLNIISTSVGRSLALERGELIVVYVMMIVASAITTMGLSEYLLPIITSPFYYATPENEWAELIQPYIRQWMVLQDADAIKHFYEGSPKGAPIPWGVWVEPLIYWGAFLAALYLVMICMMVILRKQWMERERLIYPLVQVPLEMTREESGRSLISPFFRSLAMWAGFIIPVIVSTVNAFHNYYSFIPGINITSSIPIFRRTVSLIFRLSFPMIGFSYLINLDIAFSLWFFNLLANVQKGIFRITGVASTEQLGIYGAASEPILAHQGMGAIMVLVIFGLWVARGQLKEVLLKAFRSDSSVDDSGEILSYRTAVLGTIGGLLFMGLWIWISGMPAWITILFLFGAFLIFVGLTRIVVESGVAEAVASTISSSFVVSGVGSTALGPVGMTALAFTYVWSADIRTFVMASCANGLKLGEQMRGNKKPLFWAMVSAVVISLIGSIWMIMKLSYTYGGINLNGWFFGGGPRAPFDYISIYLKSPSSPNWGGWIYTGVGAGVMVLLMLARQRLLWWPLHPIGFPIGAVWLMDQVWFSIFLAWLVKTVILRYGGPKLYRNVRPFFLGLILGQFVAAGAWLIIDYFTGMTDNVVFWI